MSHWLNGLAAEYDKALGQLAGAQSEKQREAGEHLTRVLSLLNISLTTAPLTENRYESPQDEIVISLAESETNPLGVDWRTQGKANGAEYIGFTLVIEARLLTPMYQEFESQGVNAPRFSERLSGSINTGLDGREELVELRQKFYMGIRHAISRREGWLRGRLAAESQFDSDNEHYLKTLARLLKPYLDALGD